MRKNIHPNKLFNVIFNIYETFEQNITTDHVVLQVDNSEFLTYNVRTMRQLVKSPSIALKL